MKDQLINHTMSVFETCLFLKFVNNGPKLMSRIANQVEMRWQVRTVGVPELLAILMAP